MSAVRHLHIAPAAVRQADADPVRQELAFLRAEDAELLAHARATVAAARDGWPDPVAILAGLLEERGQLPRPGQTPRELLALGWMDGESS